MNNLNKEQQQAADFLHGICSVIAVPGSGKTKTMMERIGRLVNHHGIAPESILGLTFTRSAADLMRSRLKPILSDKADRVMLNTIHGFCYWLLKNEGFTFELLLGKEQLIFLKDVLKKLKYRDLPTGMVLSEISLAKNNLISIQEFRDLYEGDKTMQKIADAYEKYDIEKEKKLFFDFDDLLSETFKYLLENEDVREKYCSTFNHILVDEFQDTNPVQNEVIKLLIGDTNNGSSYWICADPDQAIYGFNGAAITNILHFDKHFPSAEQFLLNVNYRSTPQILRACQNLIINNMRRIEKELLTNNPDGDDVNLIESSSEETEALNIVTEINDLVGSRGYVHKDISILVRANFQTRQIEETLSSQKIPYYIEGGVNFYDRTEVKVLLNYLRLISNPDCPDGDEALLSILNVPTRYVSNNFKKELQNFAENREMHLYQALKHMPIELPYIRHSLKDLRAFLDPLIDDADSLEPSEIIQLLRSTFDYDRVITEDDLPSPDDTKIANVNQLQIAAAKYKSIASFLEFTENFQSDLGHDKNGVQVMTIHKAKGLEFPVVFVIGLVEGILPSKKGDIEEERRICFVGISRAMELLYISTCQTYLGSPCKRSIFLDEILDSDNGNNSS